MTPSSPPANRNRLANATSPYLLQHADNPVDWYEWGPEALEKARRESKPIFLSIGYSACHWCHVMAHESFENQAIADVLNRDFVSIKVDREERPDLDEIYMHATMIMNQGQGGWPMSVFLTPELRPFFAGTYFPPDARWGRPGFGDLCARIAHLWETLREALLSDAQKLTEYLVAESRAGDAADARFSLAVVDRVADALAGAFDAESGGLVSGGGNKFPPSMAMGLMLRSAHRRSGTADRSQPTSAPQTGPRSDAAILKARVETTLDHMARGGIYDQLAGGFARYSTEPQWLVPHFEKMLYDQALVSRIYVDAHLATGQPLYARVARETFDYVLTDLQSPEGGFYSSRDADSEGEEGRFYVWTRNEIVVALGAADGELFCSYYDVSDSGNWADPHAPGVARNILHAPRDMETVAKLNRIDTAELDRKLAEGRRKLLEIRSLRTPPHRDEKILCEWNGLMIASLAHGGAALGEPRFVSAAERAADAILTRQLRDGRLLRSYRDGRALGFAFLTDYACMIDGLLELFEATFDAGRLKQAISLNETVIRHHWDEREGGFFFAADDHEALLTRNKDVRDGATPSGNSVQLMNLLRLATMTGNDALRRRAERMMTHFAADVLGSPGASERFLAGVDFALAGPVEIAIVGDPADARTRELVAAVRTSYVPNRVLMLVNRARPQDAVESPLLKSLTLINGEPAAYVCRNYQCERPVTCADALRARLAAANW
ncbi:MAG: thioredoxin domain-containing protein [Phycisphaerae bacterium]